MQRWSIGQDDLPDDSMLLLGWGHWRKDAEAAPREMAKPDLAALHDCTPPSAFTRLILIALLRPIPFVL